jgi:hypothetical protein
MDEKVLLELGKLGGWGVSILLIYLNFSEKKKEKDSLLNIIKGNTEAMTKLISTIEQNSRILEQQQLLLTQFVINK